MQKGAIISTDQKFRFSLERIWTTNEPLVLFIMLNPSTANHLEDDPTIRRCMGFARSWGYGGLLVGNLFAFRTKDPKKLKEAGFPEGQGNQNVVRGLAKRSEIVVCAWGNDQGSINDHSWLFGLGRNLHYLELSQNGVPKHPLYLKKELKLILYEKSK